MRQLIFECINGVVVIGDSGFASVSSPGVKAAHPLPVSEVSKLFAEFDSGKRVLRAGGTASYFYADDSEVVLQFKGFQFRSRLRSIKEASLPVGEEVF